MAAVKDPKQNNFNSMIASLMSLALCAKAWRWHTNSYVNHNVFDQFHTEMVPLIDQLVLTYQTFTSVKVDLTGESIKVVKYSEDIFYRNAQLIEQIIPMMDAPKYIEDIVYQMVSLCLRTHSKAALRK